MKIYKLSAIFLLLLVSVFHSTSAFSAVNCVQFSSEIDLKAFPNNSLCYFSKKTTEHKCFAKEVNNRNISCYSNSDNWSCKSGYRKSGEKCIKKTSTYITKKIPKNSHKVGSGWTCNYNYYRNNSQSACLRAPANSTSSNNSNYFKCNSGYSRSGASCIKKASTYITKKIPKNSHKVGSGWTCDYNYYRNNSQSACLRAPANSTSSSASNDFKCNDGYTKSGNGCIKKINKIANKIPKNSHKYGSSWVCNRDYYRNNAETACISAPANSTSSSLSNFFKCNNGYSKSGSKCIKKATALKIPNNAHKDGSTWVCNYNYYRNNPKTGCLKVPTNSTSLNDSNDFKCNSGYDKSGNRCVKKTTNNNNSCLGSHSTSWTNCFGTYTFDSGDMYVGDFVNGDFHGQGIYTWKDGHRYSGGWKNDKRNGQGTLVLQSGKTYIGGWKNSKKDGQGTTTFSNGRLERGFYKDGQFQGLSINIPQNAHKSGVSWICDWNYYRNNSQTACLRIPTNSSSSNNSNDFKCNNGYSKSGNSCIKKTATAKIPFNAHKTGTGWTCNIDYYRNNSKTSCIKIPANSSSSNSSNFFTCNTGYDKNGNRCVKKIPLNAHASGTGWICDYNYYKKGSTCQSVPLNGFSNSNSNNWYCSNGYEKIENSCVKEAKFSKNLIFLGIVIFLVLFLNRKSKAPSDSKPRSKPTSIPAPQTKPKSKAKPRSSWRRVKDPRTLVIEIAVAVAMSDGNLADIEGITINKWMKKKLDQDVNNEKIKKLFNDTLKEAHLLAESGQLNLREICSKLNSKGTKELQLEALDLAYEVMGADGHIHEKEAEMIDLLVKLLKISSTEIEEIRDQFMIKTLIINDFNILNLLGLSSSASKESKCRELKKEFKKWNGRLNILSTPLEKKNAQKVLGLLGIARKDIDC